MPATLRVVLDQLVARTDADLAIASRELSRALVRTAPAGCDVAAIVPGAPDVAGVLESAVPGLAEVTRTLARRELATAWQVGAARGVGGGMIHSPSLLAPLVKHDRIHDHDQTVVTLWDLDAWERPRELGRVALTWQRAMLKRAARFADAVVVPTHAAARRLAELAPLQGRIRVIAGAAPAGFAVPTDEIGRRRELGLPDGGVLLAGSSAPSARLADGFAAIARAGADLPVVVLDVPEGDEPAVVELAVAAGIAESRVHARGALDDADRAAALGGAVALIAPTELTSFPWRVVEALSVGVPVVAVDTEMAREVVAEGGVLAGADELADALGEVLGSVATAERYGVLAGDRGRAFSWLSSAERVWQLHADL
ncbi:MAG: glycosyltransferase [Microbacterium sp.]